MAEFLALYRNQLLVFLLVFLRVGGLIAVAPVFGSAVALKQWKVLLTVAVALLVAPLFWNNRLACGGSDLDFAVAAGREAVLGLVMGAALLLLVSGLQAAGHIIGQMSGMSLAQIIDSTTGASQPVFGKLLELAGIAFFFLVGGHRQVMTAILDSFAWMPPGDVGFHGGLWSSMQELAANVFVLALRIAAPAIAALLLSSLMVGLISRAAPQLNTLSAGLGVNAIVAIAAVAFGIGAGLWIFGEETQLALESVTSVLRPAEY